MPVIADQYFEYHEVRDIDRPDYRECHQCGNAFRKADAVLMTYFGDFYCNESCINKHGSEFGSVPARCGLVKCRHRAEAMEVA